jgi:hypothetical protein
MSEIEDGPLFRATLEDLESKEQALKLEFKKVLKLGNSYIDSCYKNLKCCNEFISSLSGMTKDTRLCNLLKESQEIIDKGTNRS